MSNIISINNLSMKFNKRKDYIFFDTTFNIKKGEYILFTGKNGTGKSTLVKTLFGYKFDGSIEGEIIALDKYDILKTNDDELQKYRSEIIYIPQTDSFSGLNNVSVYDHIMDSASAAGINISRKEIDDFFEKNSINYEFKYDGTRKYLFTGKTALSKLSGGQARLINIIASILPRKNADFIIIDEPFNNLDIINICKINNFLNAIRHDNPLVSMLIISHFKFLTFINKEIYVKSGKIKIFSEKYESYPLHIEVDSLGFYTDF